ncbi:hypothetical protein D3C87_2008430 [compost metagenome]
MRAPQTAALVVSMRALSTRASSGRDRSRSPTGILASAAGPGDAASAAWVRARGGSTARLNSATVENLAMNWPIPASPVLTTPVRAVFEG